MRRPPRIFAAIVLVVAIAFLYGGVRLVAVGGSFYYVLAGVALLASGDSSVARQQAGLACLRRVARGDAGLVAVRSRHGSVGARAATRVAQCYSVRWLLTPFARRGLYAPQPPPRAARAPARSRSIAAASALAVLAVFIVGSHNSANGSPTRNSAKENAASARCTGEWRHYGNTTHGTRYARSRPDQRVERRRPARNLALPHRPHRAVQGDAAADRRAAVRVYGDEIVVALDAETGAKRWEFDPR